MQSDDELLTRCERRVGAVIDGTWQLRRLLGLGGMAAVYAAVDGTGRKAAIKLIHSHLAKNPAVRARFQREAYIANKVDHPGVVAIQGDGTSHDGEPYIVMELLRGQSVDLLLDSHRGRLTIRDALHIAEGVLAVLVKAHPLGIVHRDLKPENVFLTSKGEVKVLDFGIARMLDQEKDRGQTRTGVIMGTPSFMAPEQALGRWSEVDARTDLWAVGALIFLLVSGRLVHGSGTGSDMLIRAATRPAPSLARVAKAPLSLVRLVDRALAFDPRRRFPDAATMLAELRAVQQEVGHGGVVERTDTGSKPPPSPYEEPTMVGTQPGASSPEAALASDVEVELGEEIEIDSAEILELEPVPLPRAANGPPSAPEIDYPSPTSKPMSRRVNAESIVDERFAESVAKAYRRALPRGTTEDVTEPIRTGLRRLATRAPDAALRLLLALCSAIDDPKQSDNEQVRGAFASAIVSTRALGALIASSANPGVDRAVGAAAIGKLLDFLGDAHAGVVLENLTAVPDGELKDLLRRYLARSSAGYEDQIGALFAHAPVELGVELVRVLRKMNTDGARAALGLALDSEHLEVRKAAAATLGVRTH
ncbi:MAG: serine/threonine protein kinase [Polyangiaceae bacterium]|nr:serine/threonine protein kinase [Polyangiaceae bacterium]MBK9000317.1 serine/threonine protein kinase [Myxococcales bacterium]MCL4752231.1 serine/threonine protein kinase [Myxococcales bacterium]